MINVPDVDLCANLSGQIEMCHVSAGVAGPESFGTCLFQDVAHEPCCFSASPKGLMLAEKNEEQNSMKRQ